MSNACGRLKPEMFGNIQLAERTEMRPTVPAAVIATDGKAVVWREKAKGVFEKVAVTLGTQTGDRVAVDGVMLLMAN